MSRRRLDACVAIVTGASSGIGRELALALAERGAQLILTARNHDRLKQVAAAAEQLGAPPPTVVVGDITDPELQRRLVDAADLCDRPLDLLINNAGVSAHGRFLDAGEDRLRQIIEVNFIAAAELTRQAVACMAGSPSPAVVNVGSILAYRGIPHNSEYCASKAALRAWSEALRAELAAERIHVMLVTPGTTDTPFFDHLIEQQAEMPWAQAQGLPPDRVARAILTGLERNRREVTPGWKAKAFVLASRWLPGVMDRVMRRYG